ncbi:hypothetical protein [Peribacillus phoenicis]|uniref:hypothetical protein n=1 Tax=unclassified Peribacillus TaxID=2675266 RepID=UPI0039A0AE8A
MKTVELSADERKRIRKVLEQEFESYRLYQLLIGSEGYIDQQPYMKAFCEGIDQAVSRLPAREKHLIMERYLNNESDYITDIDMYTCRMNPSISARTYGLYRDRAIFKLAMYLKINIGIKGVDHMVYGDRQGRCGE